MRDVCREPVYCEWAERAFDPDLYDCQRCGHINGAHCGPEGECVDCGTEALAAILGAALGFMGWR